MAGRIKGITVEIGGDTTGLEKALKNVNSTIKNTQSQLKDVNRLLKLDPSNTELLSQKQRALKDAIGATKEKLDSLKTAQEQAKQQLENGDLGQDKYDALQREIIETEQELRRLQKEAAATSTALAKIDEAGKKMESLGDSVTSAGQKSMPATMAVAGLGAAAVKTAVPFLVRPGTIWMPCGIRPGRWVPRPSSLLPRQPPLWNTWRWRAGRRRICSAASKVS